jgi:5-formyltetrahydrofolate cyclo-ligase
MGISEEKAALRTRYRRERNARYIEHSFEYLATTKELESATVIASYRSYTSAQSETHCARKNVIASSNVWRFH